MELDLKMSFLANSQPSAETNAASFKTGASSESKTFESALSEKREEVKNERKSDTKDARKTDSEKKTGTRKEKSVNDKEKSAEQEETETTDTQKKPEEPANVEKHTETVQTQEAAKPEEPAEPEIINAELMPLKLTQEETEQLLSQIAGVLGVTAEQVVKALEKLEISPEMLAVPENMNKLVMEVKGLSEPAELLTVPDISETLKELKQIVNDTLFEAEARVVQEKDTKTVAEFTPVIKKTSIEAEAETEVKVEVEVEAETTLPVKNEQTKTAAISSSETAVNTQQRAEGEVTVIDEANTQETEPKNTAKNEERTNTPINSLQFGETAQQYSSNGGETQGEATFEEIPDTPIVIQKGDETIVEIAGRTVSRSVTRPQGQDVINQIIDKMKIDFKPGQTEMKIRLNPVELGSVTVKLTSENGVVTAEIVTENSNTKELVEENLEVLKQSLKEHGVEVGGLSVSVGQQESDDRMTRFMREQTKSRARMSRIISRISEEENEPMPANYSDKADSYGYTVDYSA